MTETPAPSGRDASRDFAEAARETEWTSPSFAAELFLGRFRPDLVHPFPEQDPADRAEGDAFLARLVPFLRERVDPIAIDRDEAVPDDVIRGLAELGAFGMKIPKEYGGLGLSQLNYNRAIAMVASHCASTAVWLSAHQSIGVPQPLRHFGTEEQKRKWLPMLAKGAISGFALTEPGVGSDPAAMSTTAVPSEDGSEWILNGEKLWCTNGLAADLLIVMARTPPKMVKGKERPQVTAFVVEGSAPGIERVHTCRFLGIRGISNGLLRFRDVRVPAENLVGGEGRGLKIALVTLNTGRLTLPAAGVGTARQVLQISRRWAAEREQWGVPVGKHEAVATKLARMASHTFAMEAVSDYASGLAMREGSDIRLEAAMAKLFGSETLWTIVDDAMQIRAGRGYEREESLAGRGETPWPIERIFRDSRINTIVEGTSEIMRLFIAREALDPHLRKAGALVDPRADGGAKVKALGGAAAFYPGWYASLWLGFRDTAPRDIPHRLHGHFRYVRRTSRRLARGLFHAMVTVGPALERRQNLLGRFVDIGVDLLAMSATIALAAARRRADRTDDAPVDLADHFCQCARLRIGEAFRAVRANHDRADRRTAKSLLAGELAWLEEGILVSCPAGKAGERTEREGTGTRGPARTAAAPARAAGAAASDVVQE